MIADLSDLPEEEKRSFAIAKEFIASGTVPSDVLAARVVLYRCTGFDRVFGLFCMEELYRRRILGEDFLYEEYIEERLKTLPQLSKKIDLNNVKELVNLKTLTKILFE